MSKTSNHVWIVDVIEDGAASIEVDGRTVTSIPQWILPESAKEGDILSVKHERKEGKSMLLIETDRDATRKR
jgi:PDZ domain-containing secreted protein